jgi:GMP synthase (glutamine-hydrolysing)
MTVEQSGFEEIRNPELLNPKPVVAVLDAGGQYVDLVKKSVERLGFRAAVLPLDTPAEELANEFKALIISGSPANSQEQEAPMPDSDIWALNLPTLGICYGMQAMVSQLGGKVERGLARQDGRVKTIVETSHPLFHDTKSEQSALFTHGNFVTEIPEGFDVIGKHSLGEMTVNSAIVNGNLVGVQFHPEVFDDTPEGYQIFKNFLGGIAKLEPDTNLLEQQTAEVVERLRTDIRERVGTHHVIAFVSGGVDSSVAATLAATEIAPEKLHAYYIDNGFMRDEDDAVIDLLQHIGVPVTKIEAADYFSGATMEIDGKTTPPLVDTTDPQYKRQIIGKAFIDVQNKLVAELGLKEAILLQGTNAADRIESGHSKGGTHTALIKTHHNQVKEVQDLKARGLLLEPLDELFKDEVRTVGRFLGLPNNVVDRHPFPGPGLAIRILCATSEEFTEQSDMTEREIQTFINEKGFQELTGTDAKLLPIRNVGVGGDERSHIAALALSSQAPWTTLDSLTHELTGKFRDDINRVVVALGEQSLNNLSITPTKLNDRARQQLKDADRIVFEEMRSTGALHSIKQCPVVLLPLSFDYSGGRSIVLRPVMTSTFMTVQAMLPDRDLPEGFIEHTANRIINEVPGISQVFLDLTPKPPGTTEWE